MIKTLTFTLILALAWSIGLAQEPQRIDSLKNELANAILEAKQVGIMVNLCTDYFGNNLDSSLKYGQQALSLAHKIGDTENEATALIYIGGVYCNKGDYPKSLEFLFRGLEFVRNHKFPIQTINCLVLIGRIYKEFQDFPQSINYYKQGLEISTQIRAAGWITNIESLLGEAYRDANKLDSALYYTQKAMEGLDTSKDDFLAKTLFTDMGVIQFKMGDHFNAIQNVRKAILINKKDNDHRTLAIAFNHLADFFKTLGNVDSSIFYARQGLFEAQANNYKREILKSSKLLSGLYEHKDLEKALFYNKMSSAISDELFGVKKTNDLQKILAEEQERQRQLEIKRISYENRLKQNSFLAGLVVLLLIVSLLYRNNLREKKAKRLLQGKNELIQNTLSNLKTTQAQLIQSEKMASLGELTAGIAHEIQNPLNFVNNFSEVNEELLAEMKDELDKGNIDDAKAIANDAIENQHKILHHGKRADAIVKGMLQHSRRSSGIKEPTDINALCDEYLRLSYHGLRAKDKSFNATMKTDFDKSIGNINIIPQDIGRVILNLITNAFYVVNEKKNQGIENYEPSVTVMTSKNPPSGGRGAEVLISVKDNGPGIPKKILDKIFQPFFTTKPTGQGTGLGLSLSYDIVKAHGGEIKVETKEGEGSNFYVELPV